MTAAQQTIGFFSLFEKNGMYYLFYHDARQVKKAKTVLDGVLIPSHHETSYYEYPPQIRLISCSFY